MRKRISPIVLLCLVAFIASCRVLSQPQIEPSASSSPANAAAVRAPEIMYWQLPTGSRVAYMHYMAGAPANDSPVVFLHGGPGAFVLDHEPAADVFFSSLAGNHFDVYLYDQIGSGKSERLPDPRLYTVDRHVADLEAIRQQIGAKKMILIGDSWGAILAANYMADHPDRCAKVIFTSPGAMDPTEWAGQTVYPDAATVQVVQKWMRGFDTRYANLNEMIKRDPQAAYRMAHDSEMDPQFDDLLNRLLPTLVCNSSKDFKLKVNGTGWWVSQMISNDLMIRQIHPSAKLRENHTPALIMRGGCDYIIWDVAKQYRMVLPNSTLVHIPKAGHWIGRDQPKLYSETIRSFLLDKPLPVEPYTAENAPLRDDKRVE